MPLAGKLRLSARHRNKVAHHIPFLLEFRTQELADKMEHFNLYGIRGCGFESCKFCKPLR